MSLLGMDVGTTLERILVTEAGCLGAAFLAGLGIRRFTVRRIEGLDLNAAVPD